MDNQDSQKKKRKKAAGGGDAAPTRSARCGPARWPTRSAAARHRSQMTQIVSKTPRVPRAPMRYA